MFKPLSNKLDSPSIEKEILEFWDNNNIFLKTQDSSNYSKEFNLYEGPPTANGSPGIHHVLARVFKDIIPRYKTMKGYRITRKGGWDTHGLPVELEIEKKYTKLCRICFIALVFSLIALGVILLDKL